MRWLTLSFLILLSACGANPAALGISGAAPSEPPPDPGETQSGIPGAPETGTQLAPSLPLNTGSGKFWGYNGPPGQKIPGLIKGSVSFLA